MTARMPSPRSITSRRHPLVLACRRIASGRGDGDEILLDGEHLVDEAIAAHVRVTSVLTRHGDDDLARRAQAAGADVFIVTADVIRAASPVRTPGGVVALAHWRPAALTDAVRSAAGLVIALIDVQDPGNVGSAIRSADALGAGAVAAVGATADPAGWRALRAAMGSTFRVPVCRVDLPALFEHVTRHRIPVIAATVGEGEPLEAFRPDSPTVVLLGNEGAGLSEAVLRRADGRLQVPMRAGANSLNVAVTAALILYQAGRGHPVRPA